MNDDSLTLFLSSKSEKEKVYFVLTGGVVVHGLFLDWGRGAGIVRVTTLDTPEFPSDLTLTIRLDSIVAWGETEQ